MIMPSQYQTLFAVTSQHMKAHRERTVQPEFVARVETRIKARVIENADYEGEKWWDR